MMGAYRSIPLCAALVALTLGLAPAPLDAQAGPVSRGGATGTFESVRFSDAENVGIESLSLFSVIFAGNGVVGERLRLSVSGGFARGELERRDGSKATLSGLTDTRVTLSVPFAREYVTVSLVGVLPTGVSEQTLEEAEVASVVAADLLPFRISHWGAGGGFGGSLAVARPFGQIGLGLGVGYIMGREFNPIATNNFAYRPGDALTLTAGLDASVGRASKFNLQVTFQNFANDELDGQNLYQSGDRLQAVGSLAFPAGARSNGILYGGFVHRSNGSTTGATQLALVGSPSQDLILLGAGFRTPIGAGVLVPDVMGRLFRRDDGVGQGFYTAVGAAYELPVGRSVWIPSVRAKFGNVEVRQGLDSGFTGVDIGLTARFGGRGR